MVHVCAYRAMKRFLQYDDQHMTDMAADPTHALLRCELPHVEHNLQPETEHPEGHLVCSWPLPPYHDLACQLVVPPPPHTNLTGAWREREKTGTALPWGPAACR